MANRRNWGQTGPLPGGCCDARGSTAALPDGRMGRRRPLRRALRARDRVAAVRARRRSLRPQPGVDQRPDRTDDHRARPVDELLERRRIGDLRRDHLHRRGDVCEPRDRAASGRRRVRLARRRIVDRSLDVHLPGGIPEQGNGDRHRDLGCRARHTGGRRPPLERNAPTRGRRIGARSRAEVARQAGAASFRSTRRRTALRRGPSRPSSSRTSKASCCRRGRCTRRRRGRHTPSGKCRRPQPRTRAPPPRRSQRPRPPRPPWRRPRSHDTSCCGEPRRGGPSPGESRSRAPGSARRRATRARSTPSRCSAPPWPWEP